MTFGQYRSGRFQPHRFRKEKKIGKRWDCHKRLRPSVRKLPTSDIAFLDIGPKCSLILRGTWHHILLPKSYLLKKSFYCFIRLFASDLSNRLIYACFYCWIKLLIVLPCVQSLSSRGFTSTLGRVNSRPGIDNRNDLILRIRLNFSRFLSVAGGLRRSLLFSMVVSFPPFFFFICVCWCPFSLSF